MDAIDIKGDVGLLDLLSNVPASELELLVDQITDAGEGRLALSSAVKELLLESKRRQLYTPLTLKILISELQQFGGHSVANLVRRSGIPYAEIVRDALRHLGETSDASTPLEQQELAVVATRLGQIWPELGDVERSEFRAVLEPGGPNGSALADLQTRVRSGGRVASTIARRLAQRPYKPNHLATTAKKTLLGGALVSLAPAVLASAVDGATGPAYRVTVPCVLYLAHLRLQRAAALEVICRECGMKGASQARFCTGCGFDLRGEMKSTSDEPLSGVANIHPEGAQLMLGSGGGTPVLSVMALETLDVAKPLLAVELGASSVDRLSPLLQLIPSMAVAGEVATHRYLKVVVNGPLAPAADGNGLRGFVRGPDGRFTEHGRFFEDDRLKNLVSGAALFQIASIVVAQKHLADISRKLGEIQEGVGRIEAFQRDERKSSITGTLKYLQQVAPVLLEGQVLPAVRGELERVECSLSAVQDHVFMELGAIVKNVAVLEDRGSLGSGELTKALRSRQDDFEELVRQWQLCLATRFVACRLVCCYPGEQMLVAQRQQTLNQLLPGVLGPEGVLRQFCVAMTQRGAGLKALTDTRVELLANQERLRMWGVDRMPAMETQGCAMFGQLDRILLENAQPVALVLEVQGETIVRALAA